MTTKAALFHYHGILNRSAISRLLKRLFDVTASALILVLISPLMGLIALVVRRDSPGPVFYRGPRLGRGGKPFKILKFRTMYETSASYSGPCVTAHDDARVTPFGHWLRETKINELPQFWNVLKGEMSLVGPRPEDPSIAVNWPRQARDVILSVRPGITSPATILYGNEEALLHAGNVLEQYMEDMSPDKLRLDQLYVLHRSYWMDLDVLFWTALLVLHIVGTHSLPEPLLFVGPFTRLVRRYMSWFTIDLLVTFCAIGLAGIGWRMFEVLDVGLRNAAGLAVGFAFLFSICGVLLGTNRTSWARASFEDAYGLLPAWLAATVIAIVVNHFLSAFPLGMILVASFLALLGFTYIRYRSRLITGLLNWQMRYRRGIWETRRRVLIVGSGPNAQHAAWLLHNPYNIARFHVAGLVDNDLFIQGMRIYGERVLGVCKAIPDLIKTHQVELVVVADPKLPACEFQVIQDACRAAGTRLATLPDFVDQVNALLETLPLETPSP
jgi:lipopolysaccharide/colanic/teichoic acid biosynthesis glycosyltransferase